MTLDIYRRGNLEISISSWSAIMVLSMVAKFDVYFLKSFTWKVRA